MSAPPALEACGLSALVHLHREHISSLAEGPSRSSWSSRMARFYLCPTQHALNSIASVQTTCTSCQVFFPGLTLPLIFGFFLSLLRPVTLITASSSSLWLRVLALPSQSFTNPMMQSHVLLHPQSHLHLDATGSGLPYSPSVCPGTRESGYHLQWSLPDFSSFLPAPSGLSSAPVHLNWSRAASTKPPPICLTCGHNRLLFFLHIPITRSVPALSEVSLFGYELILLYLKACVMMEPPRVEVAFTTLYMLRRLKEVLAHESSCQSHSLHANLLIGPQVTAVWQHPQWTLSGSSLMF